MEDGRYMQMVVAVRLDMSANLYTAVSSLRRAGERLSELVAEVDRMSTMLTEQPKVTMRAQDMHSTDPPFTVEYAPPWTTGFGELRLLTSEVLHHLRSTADHLVYNVAWLDSGREQRGTQFPVCSTRSAFRKVRTERLVGVSDEHLSWFEAVQPYNGVKWTDALRRLSNDDKHNFLHSVAPGVAFRVDMHSGVPHPDDPDTVSLHTDELKPRLFLVERDDPPGRSLHLQLGDMILGLNDLINRFLDESDKPAAVLTLPAWYTGPEA